MRFKKGKKITYGCLLLFLVISPSGWAKNDGVVKTVSGTALPGDFDGTLGESSFLCPNGVAVDRDGNLFVADTLNNVIRKIGFVGTVSTLVWRGPEDAPGGPATTARLSEPAGVALDAAGNVYIAERGGNRIIELTPRGVMTVLAGIGQAGSTDGPATLAAFNGPSGVAVDVSGNVYVADTGNQLIRKISPGGAVTTLAGSRKPGLADGAGASASFNQPTGVTVDSTGDVFVADSGNNLIREISSTGMVSTLAGTGQVGSTNGPAAVASFKRPFGVAVDFFGNVFVADTGNNLIREITPEGVVSTLAGSGQKGSANGSKTAASFKYPQGVAVDRTGNVFIADTGNSMIREIQ